MSLEFLPDDPFEAASRVGETLQAAYDADEGTAMRAARRSTRGIELHAV